MHLYFNFLNKSIPGYGLMIVLGLIISNFIASKTIKNTNLNFNYFLILESYGLLGGGIGAKVLYFITIYNKINWHQLTNIHYLNSLLRGGFVFLGGLIGALISLFFSAKLHHINIQPYLQKFIFLLPLAHGFGRLGCFMAGCCYGIPYNGLGHVIFPNNSLAPANMPLFPVQLLESTCLFILSFILYYLSKHSNYSMLITYILTYSILRFFIEFLRYDQERGHIALFSTSQWISLGLIVSTTSYIICKKLSTT